MSVETATYISQLNAALPALDDPRAEGDDHLRLLKAVLQAQFPNLGAAAVTPTAAQMNLLVGVAGNILAADPITRQTNRPFSLRLQDLGLTNSPTFDFAGRGIFYHRCDGNVTVALSNYQPGSFGVLLTANDSGFGRSFSYSGATIRNVRLGIGDLVTGSSYAVHLFFALSTTEVFMLNFYEGL